MKRILVSLLFGLALGGAGGFAAGLFFFPFLFPPPPAAEQVADRDGKTVFASGMFIHANPSDPLHWGRGGVEILEGPGGTARLVHLRPDFEVGPGPRYHVYLADRAEIRSSRDFRDAATTDLGQLRAFEGSQVFPIPDAVELTAVRSVVIWCTQFNVLISPATLAKPG